MREAVAGLLDPPTADVFTSGTVITEDVHYAREAVALSITTAKRPIPVPRVRITHHRHGSPLTVVQVNLSVAERSVRTQAVATTVPEAVDLAVGRLEHLLDVIDRHLTAEEAGHILLPGEEQPGALSLLPPGPRPQTHDAGGPRLVRSKTFPLAVQQLAAAALTMQLRDYDFHLFIDEGSGVDSVVYRGASDRYGLMTTVGLRRARSAPVVTVPEAIARLRGKPSQRFLFFADASTGRGRVVYRRYDGGLGLIAPAW